MLLYGVVGVVISLCLSVGFILLWRAKRSKSPLALSPAQESLEVQAAPSFVVRLPEPTFASPHPVQVQPSTVLPPLPPSVQTARGFVLTSSPFLT